MSTGTAVYTRFELIRGFRNLRALIFSVAFPLILFLLVAVPNRNQKLGGINFPVYYMTGMMSFGTMTAVMSCGARIAQERSVGWMRQIRLTPLRVRQYFQAKILSGYATAVVSIALLSIAGLSVGVRITVGHWLELYGLILVSLVPFALMGIILGHVLTVDSMGPAMGGIVSLFAILGGSFGPLAQQGVLLSIVRDLPSYWLVQAAHTAYGGSGWPVHAWVVLGVWTLAAARLARLVFVRDTKRV